MRKEDRHQNYNADYFAENEMLLNQRSYQQELRQDKLTARTAMARELAELKNRQDEQAEAKARTEVERKETRRTAEEWEKQNEDRFTEEEWLKHARRNARTQTTGE